MDDLAAAGIDQHMAGHVQEISAAQVGLAANRNRLADRVALHVGVAQDGDADVAERVLHQARAVDAEKALAAPQIGAAEIEFGGGHDVGRAWRVRGEAGDWHEPAGVKPRVFAAAGDDLGFGGHDLQRET